MKTRSFLKDGFEDFECDSICIMADDGREYFFIKMSDSGRLTVKAPIFCFHDGKDRAMALTVKPIVMNEIHIERQLNEPK